MTSKKNEVAPEIFIPRGFRFGAHASGIKSSGKLDVSVLVAEEDCVTFGAFTQNLVRASSVDWNEARVGVGRALVINSGNSNACTGKQGESDTAEMAATLAASVACEADKVMVMSTGIIGELMPMDKVRTGISAAVAKLGGSPSNVRDFASGILTTDSFPKIVSREFETDAGRFTLLGAAKGAGMIGPRMRDPRLATMLCVFVTDFPLSNDLVSTGNGQKFQAIVDKTFNCISVDGHTSTSDQILLFAKDASGSEMDSAATSTFFDTLESTCEELAKMIPSDGEGATHLMCIEVRGNYSETELRSVGKTIADSPLVKTATFGADPNWGRIVSAAGYNGLIFDPAETSLWINGFLLFQDGTPVEFDEAEVSRSMKENFETEIRLDLSKSPANGELNCGRYWASDLTYDYVKINAEYHT